MAKTWNGGSIESAMAEADKRLEQQIAQGASLCDECGGKGGAYTSGVCIQCRGSGIVLPFGGLRHPSQIGALNRVAHAARAIISRLPDGPDRYELEVALEAVNV